MRTQPLGCTRLPDGRWSCLVWAPRVERMEVVFQGPRPRVAALQRRADGYHETLVDARPGERYSFRLDGERLRPDPASRFQPESVHGPSELQDPAFQWGDDAWSGPPLSEYVFYELHVGTFTPEGTFEAIIPHLRDLRALGVTAIELMPVAAFPGERNWGYDGVLPFAVQGSYGGPQGLRRLVNAAHEAGLALVLDVVYNHLGPDGNYLAEFGPYFTNRYQTPWGAALNFDGPESDEVRRYFVENAVQWIRDFHIDALRLDAVHAIHDASAQPFLQELAEEVRETGRRLDRRAHLIAESSLNDTRLLRSRDEGGFALDAQWSDDYHHALHTLLTNERDGYYVDFGELEQLATALREGFVYSGQYSPFRRRRHGNSSHDIAPERLVIASQNHDQIGNRMLGERLSTIAGCAAARLAAGLTLLSPYTPLLFMGEEYAEPAPFLYFVSHGAPDLIEAVRKGRREEFQEFAWKGEAPDPQDEATFLRSKLDHGLVAMGAHRQMRAFYAAALALRKRTTPPVGRTVQVAHSDGQRLLWMCRAALDGELLILVYFGKEEREVRVELPRGPWALVLDSCVPEFGGSGARAPRRLAAVGIETLALAPFELAVYTTEGERR